MEIFILAFGLIGLALFTFIVVFFDIYFRKFWNLIVLNILYVICCIPIVTIGPATAAMTKILRNYAREEHAFLWSDFWDTFKNNFWTAFVVGLIDLFAVILIYFDYVMYMQMIANANAYQNHHGRCHAHQPAHFSEPIHSEPSLL